MVVNMAAACSIARMTPESDFIDPRTLERGSKTYTALRPTGTSGAGHEPASRGGMRCATLCCLFQILVLLAGIGAFLYLSKGETTAGYMKCFKEVQHEMLATIEGLPIQEVPSVSSTAQAFTTQSATPGTTGPPKPAAPGTTGPPQPAANPVVISDADKQELQRLKDENAKLNTDLQELQRLKDENTKLNTDLQASQKAQADLKAQVDMKTKAADDASQASDDAQACQKELQQTKSVADGAKNAETTLRAENEKLQGEKAALEEKLKAIQAKPAAAALPANVFQAITGSPGHTLPEMYGKVHEKTIWAYWFNPQDCPNSQVCTLPPQVQLCVDSINKNRGTFDFKIIHKDEIDKYVNRFELPLKWEDLKPAHQKDALMNALLARYGGVALDVSTIMLRPMDDYWDEMVNQGATFRGYMYRLNGQPWRHAEVTSVWFLMSRREGIFSIAVRNQVIGMGDATDTKAYHHWYLALGDQTLLPTLEMFNYTLPKCFDDPTVSSNQKEDHFPDQNKNWCPEHEAPEWYKGLSGPPRTDTKILLRDPRDGPQLPFAFAGMVTWQLNDTRKHWKESDKVPGSPMQGMACNSPKECWEGVFLERYNRAPLPGQARVLSFVKLFHHGSELDGKTREQLLADQNTFFYQWLKLAGVVP